MTTMVLDGVEYTLPRFVQLFDLEVRRRAVRDYRDGQDACGYCILGRLFFEQGVSLRTITDPEKPAATSLAEAAWAQAEAGGTEFLAQLYYPELDEDLNTYVILNDDGAIDEALARQLLGVD